MFDGLKGLNVHAFKQLSINQTIIIKELNLNFGPKNI